MANNNNSLNLRPIKRVQRRPEGSFQRVVGERRLQALVHYFQQWVEDLLLAGRRD